MGLKYVKYFYGRLKQNKPTNNVLIFWNKFILRFLIKKSSIICGVMMQKVNIMVQMVKIQSYF